jgi:5-methylcytosine-specific restriction enzyme A
VAFDELLIRALAEYPSQKERAFSSNNLARVFRHDLADDLRSLVDDPSYLVEGSAGSGNWAETPWVAVFDPLVTTSAQRGYYIVFLFRGDGGGVYVSLNQGATQVHDEAGRDYRGVLASRAATWAGLLPNDLSRGLHAGPIDLEGRGWLTRGYESGSVLDRFWTPADPPSGEELALELNRFLSLYRALTASLDVLDEDADPGLREGEQVPPGEEGRRYHWHRRVERNPRLARDAKRYHGTTCTVCGFNFAGRYGEIGEGFIEAHHLVPMSEIGDRPRQQDPRTDFTVVCPNCHRMLHRRVPPLTPVELFGMLR